jgi:(p)ppGpp synthase/HD superfamily hydrolase
MHVLRSRVFFRIVAVTRLRHVVADRAMPQFARGLPTTRAAVAYARAMHSGQQRQIDGAPFILHPLDVAALLHSAGAPDHVIAAGALHDTLEKTDATHADLSRRFGPRVAKLVAAVTEDEQITGYAARKAALREQVARAGSEAAILFAADKLSKVREFRLPMAHKTALRKRRLAHYRHCLTLLQERLPDSPLVAALEAELEPLVASAGRQAALSSAR